MSHQERGRGRGNFGQRGGRDDFHSYTHNLPRNEINEEYRGSSHYRSHPNLSSSSISPAPNPHHSITSTGVYSQPPSYSYHGGHSQPQVPFYQMDETTNRSAGYAINQPHQQQYGDEYFSPHRNEYYFESKSNNSFYPPYSDPNGQYYEHPPKPHHYISRGHMENPRHSISHGHMENPRHSISHGHTGQIDFANQKEISSNGKLHYFRSRNDIATKESSRHYANETGLRENIHNFSDQNHDVSTNFRSNIRDNNAYSEVPPASYKPYHRDPPAKCQGWTNSTPPQKTPVMEAEKSPGQRYKDDRYPTRHSRLSSASSNASNQRNSSRESPRDQSLPAYKNKPSTSFDDKNMQSTPDETASVSENTSRQKQYRKQRTNTKVHKPHTPDRKDVSEDANAKQQMPTNVPLERNLSNVSLPESDKIKASETSEYARDNGKQNNKNAGYQRKSDFKKNDREKFCSMPDLKHTEKLDEAGSSEETVDKETDNSSAFTGRLVNREVHEDGAKKNLDHVSRKKRVREPRQKDSSPRQASQEIVSSFRKTKADLHIWTSFADAASLKEAVNQSMDISKKSSLQFVNDSINVSEQKSMCAIIVQASSKQLGKRLVKALCAKLSKTLEKQVTFHICGVEEEGKMDESSTSREEHKKEVNSNTKVPQCLSIRKRAEKILESANHEGKKKVTGTEKIGIRDENQSVDTPTKISVVVNRTFPKKDDLCQLFFTIIQNKAIPFELVSNSFVSETSQTRCELMAPSKAASKEIIKLLRSSRLAGTRIFCQFANDRLNQQLDHSSLVEKIQIEIKKTKEEITIKTERTLAEHHKKIVAYEQALAVMKSSNYSEADDDDDDEEYNCVEELALIDKLKETVKQRDTFCLRRNTLIENVGKLEPLSTSKKEFSDLLESVGVECVRLGAALPIYARREDIVKKVSLNQVSIILGETGSGKSTQMVQYIHEAGLAGQGLIACTQPRKVAAITLAERVAKEMAGKVGGLVGYKVGLKKNTSALTKIIFATDHSLLNECLTDSNLSKYTCIIVDEAHERSIYTDLLLGMIKACLPNRPDLKVIITSATIEPEIFIRYFKSDSELRVSGRTFPVEVIYSEADSSKEFENFENKAVQKAVHVHKNEDIGDILVFLTSSVEIMRCCEEFQKLMTGKTDFKCFPLHGQLPPEEQRRVFERLPQGIRKVVFATNCAETSITIDGIKYVIDTGVAKEMRYDSKRNICMLGTYVISKSSANQRKGRAGRTGSGKCYRLFSEEGYRTMKDSTEPEILRVPLSQSLLNLAELGIDAKAYDFVQSPSEEAIDSALSTLRDLGALSSEGITDIGRWISKLPIDPKQGFLVYHGNKKNVLYDSVVVASLITNGANLFYKGLTEPEAQTSAKSKNQWGSGYGDIFTWLEVYKAWIQIPVKKQSKWCQEHGINYKVMSFTKQCVNEVVAVLTNELKIKLEYKFSSDESAPHLLRKIIFDANMTSVCYYLGHVRAGYHAVVLERQVHLHPSSTLLPHNLQPEWIVYTEFTKTSRDFIKGITVVEEDWVLEAVSEGKLHVDINLAKQMRIVSVHRENVGSSVFKKLVGIRYSQLRVWEDELTNAGMKAVVVEADRDLGVFDIFSASPMNPIIADGISCAKTEVIDILKSDVAEIDILIKSGSEPSGVRVVLGQGGCVQSLLMPDQSNKILLIKTCHDTTEADIRAKFGIHGEIKECVRFKRLNPWGFIRYNTFAEAQAAVFDTRNDEEIAAVLKIDRNYKKVVSKFEARLSWCRRPIKGKGTAFIKCPPIEKAGLISRHIMLPNGSRELRVSNKGDDLVCFETGNAQELEIKQAVMKILDYDESSSHNINVNVIRDRAELSSPKDLNAIKNRLSKQFSHYVPNGKFSLHMMPPKGNAVNQVAFIHFDSPTDGFQACNILQRQLFEGDQPVEISLTLKTTLHVPKSIMNVCEDHFNKIIEGLKKHKNTEVHIRPLKNGDTAFDIKSEKVKSMIEARELLQKELEGDVINCNANDLVRNLLKRQGKETLKKIESELDILIVVNERKEQVHIYGSEGSVNQTRIEINKYLSKLAEGKQVDVYLKGQGKPPGLMKGLMRKYGSLHDDLIQEFSLSDIIIDFRQQKLSIFGSPECVDRVLASISELESSLSQSGVPHVEKGMPECVVCMCEVESFSELYRLEACGHSYCLPCFKMQMTVSQQDKNFPVLCAQESCGIALVWKDLCFCLRKRWTTEEKLMEKAVSAYVAKNLDNYKFCLTPECPVIYQITKDKRGIEFNCPSCFISLCTSCHTAFHAGLTCHMRSIEEDTEKQLQLWMTGNPNKRKICPGCKVGVEKIEGCNKMHCKACHTIFCWVCLKICADEQKCYAHLMMAHGGTI